MKENETLVAVNENIHLIIDQNTEEIIERIYVGF